MKIKKEKKRDMKARFLSLGIIFTVICLAHVTVLAFIQINGAKKETSPAASVRRVTVAGIRGEIYDRNGKLLVGNATSYDMLYEYGAMPETYAEINAELLTVLNAIETLTEEGDGGALAEDYFVLEGVYPDMEYIDALADSDSDESYYFSRILKRKKFKSNISAEELVEYYVNKYKLSEKLYTPEEITALMRLWYEMERVDFGSYQSYTIARGVDMELISYIKETGVKGVTFKTVAQREYVYPGVASHILGRVGKITAETAEYYDALGYPMDAYVGTSGCEEAFEKWLRGEDGIMVIEYDDDGNVINTYYEKEPRSGKNVYLTIDIDLQIAAEEGLKRNVEMIEASDSGALTALDPNTGALLAIASYPTYDLSRFDDKAYYASLLEDEDTPLLNRALDGVYAPGSIYKVGVALAALEEGGCDPSTRCTCTGVYSVTGQKCNGIHGTVDVVKSIEVSCNIFFYTLGRLMGIDAVTPYTASLGLGVPTGIELSERVGIVAGSEYRESQGLEWSSGDDVTAAIGQSDHGYTPLQLSVFMSSVANGGDRYSVHLLDSVHEFYTEETLFRSEPSVAERVYFGDDTHALLLRAMGRVVSESEDLTRHFRGIDVKIGGKTGTAQVNGKRDYALFSGFAPFDAPEIVVSCVIEEGVKGTNAAIAVSDVMERYFEKKAEESVHEKGD